MSRIVDVAKGVVAHLEAGVAAGAFTHGFEVELSFDPRITLESLESASLARCDVMPSRSPFEQVSRQSVAYRFGIDVCLRARYKVPSVDSDGKIDPDEIAEWVGVLEQINEYLAAPARRRLTSVFQSAMWLPSEIAMPWTPADNRELRQYCGILRANYRVDVEQS